MQSGTGWTRVAASKRDVLKLVPSSETLLSMHEEASTKPNMPIEQKFRVRGRRTADIVEEYTLSVTLDRSTKAFSWQMLRTDGGQSVLEWSKKTFDPYEVNEYLINRFTGFDKQEDKLIARANPALAESASELKEENNSKQTQAVLEGNLSKMQVPTLLQSIEMEKMTGKLEIKCSHNVAYILINEGTPVHCFTRLDAGESALLDVLSWTDLEGSFSFVNTQPTKFSTINQKLGGLLLEGASLRDYEEQIKSFGVEETSYLSRKRAIETEAAFQEAILAGFSAELQWKVYNAIDGKSRLLEVVRRTKLSKRDWLPCISNLLKSGVISGESEPTIDSKVASQESLNHGPLLMFDWSSVAALDKTMRNIETGLYLQEAFLLFLRREFERFSAHRASFSVIIFEVQKSNCEDKGGLVGVAHNRLAEPLIDKVAKLQRIEDIFAHFIDDRFALLMPDTDQEQCNLFGNSLLAAINVLNDTSGTVMLGTATVPIDGTYPQSLLGKALSRIEAPAKELGKLEPVS